jgi:hypothetical protein
MNCIVLLLTESNYVNVQKLYNDISKAELQDFDIIVFDHQGSSQSDIPTIHFSPHDIPDKFVTNMINPKGPWDYFPIWAHENKYEYYWVIEDLVYYSGNWTDIFNKYVNIECDLLTNTEFHDFEWNWWNKPRNVYGKSESGYPYDSFIYPTAFLPFSRFSRQLIEKGHHYLDSGHKAFIEIFWPTICLKESLSVMSWDSTDIGDFSWKPSGQYVKPTQKNKLWYPKKIVVIQFKQPTLNQFLKNKKVLVIGPAIEYSTELQETFSEYDTILIVSNNPYFSYEYYNLQRIASKCIIITSFYRQQFYFEGEINEMLNSGIRFCRPEGQIGTYNYDQDYTNTYIPLLSSSSYNTKLNTLLRKYNYKNHPSIGFIAKVIVGESTSDFQILGMDGYKKLTFVSNDYKPISEKEFQIAKRPHNFKLEQQIFEKEYKVIVESKPIFVSFYTNDDIYKPLALNLQKNLTKFGIEFDFLEIERTNEISKQDWNDTTAMKPKIIHDMLLKHKRPVVWIDVDSIVTEFPHFLYNYNSSIDIAYHLRKNNNPFSAIMFIQYNNKMIEFMKHFHNSAVNDVENIQQKAELWYPGEQATLQKLQNQFKSKSINFVRFPKNAISKCDENKKTIFKEIMASRQVRQLIN